MKTTMNIFFFALVLALAQACGSKPKEGGDAVTTEATAQEKAAKEKQEAAEVRAAAQKERLRVAAEKRAAAEAFYKDASGDVIYNRAEVAPSYQGGEDAMTKYFRTNLKYPEGAQAKGWEGTVYVEFVVGKDGKARAAMVTEETDADTDQGFKDEAIRVVNNMPAWNPGTQKGKPVHVRYNLPIAFKLG
jgi:TonB family protein